MMKFTDAICLRKRYAVSSCGAEEVPVVSCGAVVSSCSAEEVAFVSSAGGPGWLRAVIRLLFSDGAIRRDVRRTGIAAPHGGKGIDRRCIGDQGKDSVSPGRSVVV